MPHKWLVAAVAVALPAASALADEPVRLDAAQLDRVTAAAATGLALSGQSSAYGALFSQATTNFYAAGSSGPGSSAAGGSVMSSSWGVGGQATATANTQVDALEGDITYTFPVNLKGSGAGYAWSFSSVHVYAFSSDWLK